MSILNRTNDGLHSVLIALYKCLLFYEKLSLERLLDLCAPSSLTDQEMARKTLNTWLKLGLFDKTPEGEAMISANLPADARDRQRGPTLLPLTLRTLVLGEPNNNKERFWEAEEARSADFTKAVSWLLAQDVYTMPGGGHSSVERLEIEQFGGTAPVIQNNTRWSGLKAWASYLGFAWISRFPTSNYLTVDPTPAVREALPSVFGKSRIMPQAEFFARLSQVLPVVDGGRYRLLVEERLSPASWQPPPLLQISTSLSLALMRLDFSKELRLEAKADADQRSLLGRNRREWRKVSHIAWQGEA